jgi:uncharacterized delta-60 repeat protein/uncharacterized repeat protein (TIGR01451 family)
MGARRLAGLTAAALLTLPAAPALGAPATPDPGFGTGGAVVTDFTGRDSVATGMLLDSAHRPVVVAKTGTMELGLMRRTPDGAPGFATTASLGTGEASLLTDVVEQPGGGYVAGGWIERAPAGRRFALVRFSDAGAFEGVVTDSPSADDEIRALAIRADGRIVAAGRSGDRIGGAFYAPGGAQEKVFVHDFTSVTEERADGVVVEPGGRILLAGTGVVNGERRFLLAALTPDGAIDATFGAGGLVTLDVGDAEAAVRSVERQPDGKLLVAGTTDGAGTGGGVVARFLPDGTPDIGFSTDGIARVGVPGVIVEDVALQLDGKVVAVGAVDAATATSDSIVARFRPGGVRDPGFGVDGVVRRSLGPAGADGLTGVGIAAGGGIVAGGLARGPEPAIVLAALTGGDSSDPALAMTAGSLGDLVSFTITATNPGSDPAQDVKVTVAPPGGVAATALTTAGGVCAGSSCSLGTVPPGVTRRMTLLARAQRPGPLSASARLTGATFDVNLGNNSASATGMATANRVVRRDRTKPRLGLRLRARRIRQVRKRVRLVVRTSEAASVVVRTRWTANGKTRTFAKTRTVKLGKKGAKTVRLTLTRAGRKAVKRKRTRRLALSVKARARDRAGNKRTATLRKTLRRKPRKN